MTNFTDLDVIAELLPDFVPLPERPQLYFLPDSLSTSIPLMNLVSVRLRPEGVRNAAALMERAARGEVDRRKPICVSPRPDGKWDVQDGNSTVAVARLSRWNSIPCLLEKGSEGF